MIDTKALKITNPGLNDLQVHQNGEWFYINAFSILVDGSNIFGSHVVFEVPEVFLSEDSAQKFVGEYLENTSRFFDWAIANDQGAFKIHNLDPRQPIKTKVVAKKIYLD